MERNPLTYRLAPLLILLGFFHTPVFTISDQGASPEMNRVLYFPPHSQRPSSALPITLSHRLVRSPVCHHVCEAFSCLRVDVHLPYSYRALDGIRNLRTSPTPRTS